MCSWEERSAVAVAGGCSVALAPLLLCLGQEPDRRQREEGDSRRRESKREVAPLLTRLVLVLVVATELLLDERTTTTELLPLDEDELTGELTTPALTRAGPVEDDTPMPLSCKRSGCETPAVSEVAGAVHKHEGGKGRAHPDTRAQGALQT
jgi:hypothetical protein